MAAICNCKYHNHDIILAGMDAGTVHISIIKANPAWNTNKNINCRKF